MDTAGAVAARNRCAGLAGNGFGGVEHGDALVDEGMADAGGRGGRGCADDHPCAVGGHSHACAVLAVRAHEGLGKGKVGGNELLILGEGQRLRKCDPSGSEAEDQRKRSKAQANERGVAANRHNAEPAQVHTTSWYE
jgi:hypothetical protein